MVSLQSVYVDQRVLAGLRLPPLSVMSTGDAMDRDEIFDGFEQELIWLIREAGGLRQLARQLQISQPAISHWLRRKRLPSPQQALNIEAYTKGKIRRETIRPDIYPSTILIEESSGLEGFKKKPMAPAGAP